MTTSWRLRAECSGQEDVFFQGGRAKNDAIKICSRCDVREECLEFALTMGENWGIWGGHTARERLKILNFRNQLNGTLPTNPRANTKKPKRTNFRIS
jgi:WhiB family redox-sensing transcriptional regulator